MTGADLAARITAAAAVRADFERERQAFATGAGPRPEWADWAVRLSATAGQLLAVVDDAATMAPAATGLSPDGSAVVAAADVPVVTGALADAVMCHDAHGDDRAVIPAYRRVGHALGDER